MRMPAYVLPALLAFILACNADEPAPLLRADTDRIRILSQEAITKLCPGTQASELRLLGTVSTISSLGKARLLVAYQRIGAGNTQGERGNRTKAGKATASNYIVELTDQGRVKNIFIRTDGKTVRCGLTRWGLKESLVIRLLGHADSRSRDMMQGDFWLPGEFERHLRGKPLRP